MTLLLVTDDLLDLSLCILSDIDLGLFVIMLRAGENLARFLIVHDVDELGFVHAEALQITADTIIGVSADPIDADLYLSINAVSGTEDIVNVHLHVLRTPGIRIVQPQEKVRNAQVEVLAFAMILAEGADHHEAGVGGDERDDDVLLAT